MASLNEVNQAEQVNQLSEVNQTAKVNQWTHIKVNRKTHAMLVNLKARLNASIGELVELAVIGLKAQIDKEQLDNNVR